MQVFCAKGLDPQAGFWLTIIAVSPAGCHSLCIYFLAYSFCEYLPDKYHHACLARVLQLADFLAVHDRENQKFPEFSKLFESVFDARLLVENRRRVKLFCPILQARNHTLTSNLQGGRLHYACEPYHWYKIIFTNYTAGIFKGIHFRGKMCPELVKEHEYGNISCR